jgi:hypothetical protein
MTELLANMKSMIEFASAQAEKLFRKDGVIYPIYHCIKKDGETLIVPPLHDSKDVAVAMMKALFVIEKIDRYVFIDEAWMLDAAASGVEGIDLERVRREGVKDHPDRREIVMFSAENRRGEMLTGRRFILRPEHGKPTLSPLHIDPPYDHSEGRMVGLLPKET